MHPDGTGVRALTHYPTTSLRATQPRYTPDGTHILFTAVMPKARELWLMPANGGTPHRITHGGIATHGSMQPGGGARGARP